MSDSVRPHRWQPTRLPRRWDSLGKNTGVGCHFLLQCVKVKSESEVPQSCPILRDPMVCSAPGSSIHGIFLARVLEWGAIAFSWSTQFLGGFVDISFKTVVSEIWFSVQHLIDGHLTDTCNSVPLIVIIFLKSNKKNNFQEEERFPIYVLFSFLWSELH